MTMTEKDFNDDVKGELPLYNEAAPVHKHSKYGKHKKFAGAAAALYLTGSALYYSPASQYARGFFGNDVRAHRGHHGHHNGPKGMGHGMFHGEHAPFDKLEGPQYIPDQLVRSDIAEDRNGVPLFLQIEVVDSATSQPIDNVSVDVWQADASGHYSGMKHHGGHKGGRLFRGPSSDGERREHGMRAKGGKGHKEGECGMNFWGSKHHKDGEERMHVKGEDKGHRRPHKEDFEGSDNDDEPRGRARGRGGKQGGRRGRHADQDKKGDKLSSQETKEHRSPAGRGPCAEKSDRKEHSPSAMKKDSKKSKDGKKKKHDDDDDSDDDDERPPHGPPPHDGPHGPHGPPGHGPPGHGPPPHGPPPHHKPPKDGKKHHKHNGTESAFEHDFEDAKSHEATWLRGVQQTTESGTVSFTSIFPAPNHHRASHIHYKLHAPVEKTFEGRFHNMDTHVLATGQLFFDDSLVEEILKLAEYEKVKKHVSLQEDRIFDGQGLISDVSFVDQESVESGIKAKVTLSVDASDYLKKHEHEQKPDFEVIADDFTDSDAE